MNYKFVGKEGFKVSQKVKNYVKKKFLRFQKFFGGLATATVTFQKEKECLIVRAVLKSSEGFTFIAELKSAEVYEGVDILTDKLEKQIRRFKGKLKDKARTKKTKSKLLERQIIDLEKADEPSIIYREDLEVKPMSVEEAILQMDLIKKNYWVFLNALTEKINVVYKRKDGNYGLIDPKI